MKRRAADCFVTKVFITFLILEIYFIFGNQRIMYKFTSQQIFLVHINRRDLVVLVGFIVIYPLIGINAGGIDGNFIFTVPYIATTLNLQNRTQNMEKLTYAYLFTAFTNRV